MSDIKDTDVPEEKVDYLEVDTNIPGQNYVCLSFISPEDLIARTEVTKRITEYCKKHSLQKEEDKRTIHADKTLRTLLRLKKGDELTFFNLQKYMKVHYPNKDGIYIHQ